MNKTIILLVDDNKGFSETVQEFLKPRGYEVLLGTDITTAKSLIVEDRPALVIIDERLVKHDNELDESGLTLTKHLDPQLPKIILKQYRTLENVREMLKPGPDGKPLAKDVVSKEEALHSLLTSIRLTLAHLPPTL